MRRLLRRLAWLIARLFLVLVLSFFVLAKATRTSRGDQVDFSTDRLEDVELPLFFNTQPADLEYRVNAIVERLSRGLSERDTQELHRLGGATLPLLLPQLPSLPQDARDRIAWALLPLAQRMTWRGASEIRSPAQANAFFVETWKERSVDYQPPIVQRWVERLATRGGSALLASVLEYDTYALPSLMAALPEVATADDVERARRLLNATRRMTGLPWTISARDTPDQARSVIDHWRRWWRLHAIEYTTARGPSRWSAMLIQTRFGQWASLAWQHRFGCTKAHHPIAKQLTSAGLRSLMLLFAGAVGTIAVALFKHRRARIASPASRPPIAAFALESVPQASVVAVLSLAGLAQGMAAAAAIACIAMAHLDLERIDQLDTERRQAEPSSGPNPTAVRRRRPLPNWLFAGHTWPFMLTLVFVIEKAFGINGLGQCCVDAFRQRDLHMLMAVTTITALWLLLLEFAVQLNHPFRHHRPPKEPSP